MTSKSVQYIQNSNFLLIALWIKLLELPRNYFARVYSVSLSTIIRLDWTAFTYQYL